MLARSLRPITIVKTALALPVLAVALAATPAHGQIGDSTGLAELMFPEYYDRDVVLFVEGLNLDETQRVIIEALFQDYLDGFTDAEAAMRQRFEDIQTDLQAADKTAIVALALQPLRDLINDKDNLETRLLSGVQTVLTEDQLAQWPSFVRKMRREKTMTRGRLDGESIDLFHIIRDMRLPDIAMRSITAILAEYETALDQGLIERNDSFQRAQLNLLDSISATQDSISTDEAERQVGLRVRIRDINDHYREAIAQALPPDLGAQFRQMALERAYPQIYRKTLMQRTLTDAMNIPGLSEGTVTAIRDLQLSYEIELADANTAMLVEHQQTQPKEMLERIDLLKARMSGQRPTRAAERARVNTYTQDEIAEPYMNTLLTLLTPEQFATLTHAQRFLERQQRLERMRQAEKLDPASPTVPTVDEGRPGRGGGQN
jgi:hypothetical protein